LPTIEENRIVWNNSQQWTDNGEIWSDSWGSPDNQWVWTILPRIHRYIPTERILEIAPGFGRWTNYLKDLCKELIVVDLSELCIQRCRERFSSATNISYYANDGKNLDMIPDKSIDFAFSFDSLSHAEPDVIEAYLAQLARKFKPNGVGFLHHSNLGAYRLFSEQTTKMLHFALSKTLGFNTLWRSRNMTSEKFADLVDKAGMQAISQEKINWHNNRHFLIDCFTVFTQKSSKWARPSRALVNGKFMQEAHRSKTLFPLYGQA
jgi:ubiquinone/menaquinone biosynthesis C-methylase UbiE